MDIFQRSNTVGNDQSDEDQILDRSVKQRSMVESFIAKCPGSSNIDETVRVKNPLHVKQPRHPPTGMRPHSAVSLRLECHVR